MLYRLTSRHGNRTRCQITRKIVHRDSRSCISIKMRMNRSRNIFCISEESGSKYFELQTYHRNRVDISKIQRLYIFPEDIDKLYRGGIHCNFMYRESRFRGWDSFHHSSVSIRGRGVGRVDSRRRRDKMEEVREKKCRKKGEERR